MPHSRLRKVPQEVYDRIDNSVYSVESETWWQPDSAFYQMKVAFNPVRVGYAKKVLFDVLKIDPKGRKALEVGSGGGYISEEIARMGFGMTGVDPSERSIKAAAEHAAAAGLAIRYEQGSGESLPYPDGAFDAVFCCDVLEHVRDLPKVVAEIARVLKPGGVFIYDTINRTWISKLVATKVCQTWKRWAFMPANLHVWEMFIKPRELKLLLRTNGLEWKEHRGVKPNVPIPRVLSFLRKRAKGEWTYRDLSSRIQLVEGRSTAVMYLGYAVKTR